MTAWKHSVGEIAVYEHGHRHKNDNDNECEKVATDLICA